jgi:hypothetical protein
VTALRQRMLEDMQLRDLAPKTQEACVGAKSRNSPSIAASPRNCSRKRSSASTSSTGATPSAPIAAPSSSRCVASSFSIPIPSSEAQGSFKLRASR